MDRRGGRRRCTPLRYPRPDRPRPPDGRSAARHLVGVGGTVGFVVVRVAAGRAGGRSPEQPGDRVPRGWGHRLSRGGGRPPACRGPRPVGHRTVRRIPSGAGVGLASGAGRGAGGLCNRSRPLQRSRAGALGWSQSRSPPRPGCSGGLRGSPGTRPSRPGDAARVGTGAGPRSTDRARRLRVAIVPFRRAAGRTRPALRLSARAGWRGAGHARVVSCRFAGRKCSDSWPGRSHFSEAGLRCSALHRAHRVILDSRRSCCSTAARSVRVLSDGSCCSPRHCPCSSATAGDFRGPPGCGASHCFCSSLSGRAVTVGSRPYRWGARLQTPAAAALAASVGLGAAAFDQDLFRLPLRLAPTSPRPWRV